MADKQTFKTELLKADGMDATGIKLPFDIEEVWGAKRVKVKAVINGADYRGSAVRMAGEYWMGVPKAFRDAAGIKTGDHIEVTIERDDEPRTVTPPDDLVSAIVEAGLQSAWDGLNYTNQKESARSVIEAKAAETRAKRIDKVITMLQSKK
jgi:bifunctional DNA-binding transcriptional regulator/antitoxin component of YhaV-PrlF toxin-antitoxin module